MPTVLITGANRGIGLQLATQYAAEGWTVIGCCRNPAAADALKALPGVEVEALDVTDDASVQALAAKLKGRPVDVLFNNAGIYGPRGWQFGKTDFDAMREVMETNLYAPVRIAEAFAANVLASDAKKIATVSSVMGSIGRDGAGELIYRTSKTAVNMAMHVVAKALAGDGVTSVVMHPGWVQTDMGGTSADIDAATSAAGMRKVVANAGPADSGGFFNYDGSTIEW
jgi:NAD(P)-dependent dehydrogenase (short-subunit alcohol dehydrogenase family)